jgi:CRP-like cAMP-binding protein
MSFHPPPFHHQSSNNQLLSALPPSEYQRLSPHLEWAELSQGDILYEMGEPIRTVYFPVDALVSSISPVHYSAIEFSLIGNDGIVGLPALLGGESTISRAVVQMPGTAMRIESPILRAEFMRGGVLQNQILLYLQWFVTQLTQNAACQARHSIEPRLARWLLAIGTQLQKTELPLTQQYIADLLGTRRATITEAAQNLQQTGVIRYRRGVIRIVNRLGLEERACECYALLHKEQERLQAIRQSIH